MCMCFAPHNQSSNFAKPYCFHFWFAALCNFSFFKPGEVGSMVGYFIDAKELIRHKIREKPGTAAFVLCSSECFMDDFVGIVALLGTVPNSKIGK